MGSITINDHSIWMKHLPSRLQDVVRDMRAGDTVKLEIDGIIGVWERMADGKDGRPTFGLKPVDAMREVWKNWQSRRGEWVTIRLVDEDDAYLRAVSETLKDEWSSADDELAYRDL